MKCLIVALLVTAGSCVVYGDVICRSQTGNVWYCSYQCCDYDGCCISLGTAYWYAWVLITLLFLVCLCCCVGCGGYRYRRYYVVRQVNHPAPVVVTTHSQGYQQFHNPNQYKGYEQPPPYNPNTKY